LAHRHDAVIYHMPLRMRWRPAAMARLRLLPIGWIVLNVVFLYDITVRPGQFDIAASPSPGSPPTAVSRRC